MSRRRMMDSSLFTGCGFGYLLTGDQSSWQTAQGLELCLCNCRIGLGNYYGGEARFDDGSEGSQDAEQSLLTDSGFRFSLQRGSDVQVSSLFQKWKVLNSRGYQPVEIFKSCLVFADSQQFFF